MKLAFITIETKSPSWLEDAKNLYQKKIGAFCSFETIGIKSPQIARDDQKLKLKKEEEKILAKLKPGDFLVIFDEKGKSYRSLKFADELQKRMELSPSRIVFLIGGAFGLPDELKARADWKISLSEMTMNHWVAQLMAMEQIYRAFAILKNIPYHNE